MESISVQIARIGWKWQLRLTNGKPALARWIGDVETRVG
jgi:hypothetical protein